MSMFEKDLRTEVIAEVGVNHNGSIELARKLVLAAAQAGADCVKFQTFRSELLVSQFAQKAEYQKRTTGAAESQLQMLKKLELSHEAHFELKRLCEEHGVEFLSSPFDSESLQFLVRDLGVKRLKLGSGELTNLPLIVEAGRTQKPLILSTGMAELREVRVAIGAWAYGWDHAEQPVPTQEFFEDYPLSRKGASELTVLQCVTEYPAPLESAQIGAMQTLRAEFGVRVGYSDHVLGQSAVLYAVAHGARVIEKHLTLDKTLPGPDHSASLEPAAFAEMVRGVREMDVLRQTDSRKRPHPSEVPNRAIARKSLVALRAVKKGEHFSAENVGIKRPGSGMPPVAYWSVLGRTASRDYAEDELLAEETK